MNKENSKYPFNYLKKKTCAVRRHHICIITTGYTLALDFGDSKFDLKKIFK